MAEGASWSGPKPEALNELKWKFEGRRREQEFERRRRELLAPR
ncbi:MAG: hypothetical protein ABFS86_04525 [Planctomycetota bacterium]